MLELIIDLQWLFVWYSSPNLAYNDDEVASYDDEDEQGQQDADGRLNPVTSGWNAERRYSRVVDCCYFICNSRKNSLYIPVQGVGCAPVCS